MIGTIIIFHLVCSILFGQKQEEFKEKPLYRQGL